MKNQMTGLLGGLVLGFALTSAAHAAPPPQSLAEINYLLTFVEQSGCEFYRNGTWYDSGKAAAHLRYKYEALLDHEQIETTDDFIEKAATKSSLSGRVYKVKCSGSPELTSRQWLRDALTRYRAYGKHDAMGAPVAPRPTFSSGA